MTKRAEFNFPIINLHFLSSALSNCVYVSKFIRSARACSYFTDFRYKSVLLTQKRKSLRRRKIKIDTS